MELSPGLTATVQLTVTVDDTALALRSGDVAVLATPRVVALLEEATVAAVAPALEPGLTTVGTRVELDHLAPSAVGATVVGLARLVAVDGRRLTFDVSLSDGTVDPARDASSAGERGAPGPGAATVARGRVERVVVDRARFAARAGS